MRLVDALAVMERDPDTIGSVEIDEMTVGWKVRRSVREALEGAEQRGATVIAHEFPGLFKSTFVFQMYGTGHQLVETLRCLVDLLGEAVES